SAMSPSRAAALPLMRTVRLTSQMVPRLDGGLTKAVPGAAGTCVSRLVAVLPTVAALHPLMRTLSLNAPSIAPAKVCGASTCEGPGTTTRCASVALISSPCLAAGVPMMCSRSIEVDLIALQCQVAGHRNLHAVGLDVGASRCLDRHLPGLEANVALRRFE